MTHLPPLAAAVGSLCGTGQCIDLLAWFIERSQELVKELC